MTTRRITAWALAGALGVVSLWATLAARTRLQPKLDAAQILEKSEAAHGGREAWAKVQTMTWSGHVERGGGAGPRPQFLFAQKRPNLTRFEVAVQGQRSVRVYDGQRGWKQVPSASGRPELQPYDEDELRAARDAPVIDGPVLGARAKGAEVKLEGLDQVEGRAAYRLSTRLPSGTTQRVWIDAESFLAVRYDRPGRDGAGRPSTADVFLRDYQTYQGLKIPFTIETHLPGGGAATDRLVIERIAIDANLPDGLFARPGLRTARRGITVDTRSAGGGQDAPSPTSYPMRAPSAAAPNEGRGSTP